MTKASVRNKYSKEFFEFSTWGEPDDGPEDIYRWSGVISLEYPMIARLRECSPIHDWPSDVTCEMSTAGPIEDGPDFPQLVGEQVVSQRARGVLEAVAPGGAQYLPVQVLHQGVPCATEPYWAVNWLHLVDAIDRSQSFLLNQGTDSEEVFKPYIVSGRVPRDCHAFRLRGYQSRTIVRKTLEQAVKKHGLTGFIFERCLGD